MRNDIRVALHRFEQATIRAWSMDTEDAERDKERASTRAAHAQAELAKADLVAMLEKLAP